MKKFLTVLLALSVVFTYTVGTAFAQITDSDAQASTKDYIEQQAQSYLDGDFEQKVTNYMGTLGFDKDNLLTKVGGTELATAYKSILSKAVINDAATAAATDAKTKFIALIAKYKEAYIDNATELDKNTVIDDVKAIFEAVIDGKDLTTTTYISVALTGENVSGFLTNTNVGLTLNGSYELTDKTLLVKQYDINKKAAEATLAYDSSKYSNDINDWSIQSTGAAAPALNFTDLYEGSLPGTYTWANLVDKTGPMTAKEFVEAIVAKQMAVVNDDVATDDAAGYAGAIGAMADATDIADAFIKGHKMESTADYYIKSVPTLADMEDTTSLEGAKASAIRQMEAALNSKSVTLETALDNAIASLDKLASLTSNQKKNLEELKKAKAALSANIAAAKSVYTQRINYAATKAEVASTLGSTVAAGTVLAEIDTFATAADGFDAATKALFKQYAGQLSNVDALKAEADLLLQMVDVNGKPYYDADTLKANLEKQTKLIITANKSLDDAIEDLAEGQEGALLSNKVAYINFVKGTNAASLEPKDSKGKTVNAPWATLGTETATANTTGITAMKSGNASAFGKDIVASDSLYAKAQKKQLAALVEETEAAIQAAKSISEIEKIFAEAHDKYLAIDTVNDHKTSWVSGKLAAAYTKAKYDTELLAHVTAFNVKNNLSGGDYPLAVNTIQNVMDVVVYPIVYGAYSTDELADKVAEAKAAVDKLATTKAVQEQAKAVEALVNALPSKIALTDKDAIVAAADANDTYSEVPGSTPIVNQSKLQSAIKDYEKLAADELDEAFDALDAKTITVADADAVKALRSMYDAYDEFCTDYYDALGARTADTNDNVLPDADSVKKLEAELLKAQVADVKAQIIKIPANPTAKDKAAVEAARAAFEALPLDEQLKMINSTIYKTLLDAEESLGISAKYAVESLKIKASSKLYKGKKIRVKWRVADGDATAIDGYRVYKSTKMNTGYKFMGKTKKLYMDNKKSLKKGKRYFYKVRAYKVIDGKTYYSDYSNLANRYYK